MPPKPSAPSPLFTLFQLLFGLLFIAGALGVFVFFFAMDSVTEPIWPLFMIAAPMFAIGLGGMLWMHRCWGRPDGRITRSDIRSVAVVLGLVPACYAYMQPEHWPTALAILIIGGAFVWLLARIGRRDKERSFDDMSAEEPRGEDGFR